MCAALNEQFFIQPLDQHFARYSKQAGQVICQRFAVHVRRQHNVFLFVVVVVILFSAQFVIYFVRRCGWRQIDTNQCVYLMIVSVINIELECNVDIKH